jgi:hypothetical protein
MSEQQDRLEEIRKRSGRLMPGDLDFLLAALTSAEDKLKQARELALEEAAMVLEKEIQMREDLDEHMAPIDHLMRMIRALKEPR